MNDVTFFPVWDIPLVHVLKRHWGPISMHLGFIKPQGCLPSHQRLKLQETSFVSFSRPFFLHPSLQLHEFSFAAIKGKGYGMEWGQKNKLKGDGDGVEDDRSKAQSQREWSGEDFRPRETWD